MQVGGCAPFRHTCLSTNGNRTRTARPLHGITGCLYSYNMRSRVAGSCRAVRSARGRAVDV